MTNTRRSLYFRSPAPWITVAVGFHVLAPHLVWLVNNRFEPFSYSVGTHELDTLTQLLRGMLHYIGGSLGYAAVPALLVWGLTRPDRAAFLDSLWPQTPTRRLVAVAFWAPLLLSDVVALIFRFKFDPLWTMCGFVLMPVVLLSSERLMVGRRTIVTVTAVAVTLPLIMLMASPGIALGLHITGGVKPRAAHARLLAKRIEREWRKVTDQPLRYVGGDLNLAYQTAFYLPAQVSAFPISEPQNTPWVTPTRIARAGIALTSPVAHPRPGQSDCHENWFIAASRKVTARLPDARCLEVKITRSYFGIPGKPAYYLIIIAPPPKKP